MVIHWVIKNEFLTWLISSHTQGIHRLIKNGISYMTDFQSYKGNLLIKQKENLTWHIFSDTQGIYWVIKKECLTWQMCNHIQRIYSVIRVRRNILHMADFQLHTGNSVSNQKGISCIIDFKSCTGKVRISYIIDFQSHTGNLLSNQKWMSYMTGFQSHTGNPSSNQKGISHITEFITRGYRVSL